MGDRNGRRSAANKLSGTESTREAEITNKTQEETKTRITAQKQNASKKEKIAVIEEKENNRNQRRPLRHERKHPEIKQAQA